MGPASSLVKRFPRPPVVRGKKKISDPQFHRPSANSPMAMARLARPGPPLLQFSSCRTGAARPPPPRRDPKPPGGSFDTILLYLH